MSAPQTGLALGADHRDGRLGLARVDAPVLVAWACWLIALFTAERVAVLAASRLPLSPAETQLWVWSRDLAFGTLARPPLLAWVVRATTAWAGDTEFGVRVAAPLMHAGTAFIVLDLGRRLFGERVGAWAGAVYVTLPGVWVSAMVMSADVPLMLAYGALLLCLVRALEAGGGRWWLGVGLALGLGLLASPVMAVALPSLALFLLLSPPHRRILADMRFWAGLALALAIVLPSVAGGVPDLPDVTVADLRPATLLLVLAAQPAIFGPVLLPVLAAAVAMGRRWLDGPWALLPAFVLPQALGVALVALVAHAQANWPAVIYVPGTLLAVAAAARWRWGAWAVAGSLILHSAAGLAAQNYHWLARLAGVELTRATDPYHRLMGWDRLGRALSLYLSHDPGVVVLTDDRTLGAEIAFYAKPPPTQAAWGRDPSDPAAGARAVPDARFLLVTGEADPGRVTRWFAQAETVSVITLPIYPGFERRLALWELSGLKAAPTP